MKKLALVLCAAVFSVFISICPTKSARAEVYGYNLKISVLNNGSALSNGAAVSRSDILSGKLKLKVKVIDPAQPNATFEVSEWIISIASSNKSGEKIGAGAGLWSLVGGSGDLNEYNSGISLLDGNGIDRYFSTISAQGSVNGRLTNIAQFKIVISDTSTPETLATPSPQADFIISKSGGLSNLLKSILSQFAKTISNALDYAGVPSNKAVNFLFLATIIVLIAIALLSNLTNTVTLFSFGDTFAYALLFLIPRTRKPKWGKVVEASSEVPLPYARVTLFDNNGRKLSRTRTNRNGDFGFRVPFGEYGLVISKNAFVGPDGKKTVELRPVVYNSQREYFIKPTELMLALAISRRVIILGLDFTENILAVALFIILAFGIILTTNNLIDNRSQANILFLTSFAILTLFSLQEFAKKRRRGHIPSGENLKSKEYAIVRLRNEKDNRLIKTAITNKNGFFSSLIKRGKISFEISQTS